MKLLLPLLLAALVPSINANSNNTRIEQQLETEIDLREPRTFMSKNTEFLVVRNIGFNTINRYTASGQYIRTEAVNNWERFALNYWFETRTPYSSCNMEPLGISVNFDWTLLIPCMFANPDKPPSTIYVHNYMLPHFIESTLHFMDPSYRFVLVSGGTDLTIPRSAGDSRYHLLRGFAQGADGGAYFQKLVNDPRLIHWFCENHDLKHAKLSTMPTGLVWGLHDEAVKDMPTNITAFAERPLKILVSDRVREGTGQWYTRKHVVDMCDALPQYCMRPAGDMSNGVSHLEFIKLVASVPFIACAHGGGMDPSPKAWEAIMAGTIPIIQRSVLDDAYSHLPVAFVDSWEELLQPANYSALEIRMRNWMKDLQPYYAQGSALRRKTLDKLKTAYWMEQVHHKVKEYHTLELQRTANATAAAATAPAPAAGSERHLHGQQHGGGGGALHGHEKRGLKEQLQVQQEHLQQQPLARKVRELREAAIATAQRDGTWLTNPALESTVRDNAQGPHDAVKKNWMKWW